MAGAEQHGDARGDPRHQLPRCETPRLGRLGAGFGAPSPILFVIAIEQETTPKP